MSLLDEGIRSLECPRDLRKSLELCGLLKKAKRPQPLGWVRRRCESRLLVPFYDRDDDIQCYGWLPSPTFTNRPQMFTNFSSTTIRNGDRAEGRKTRMGITVAKFGAIQCSGRDSNGKSSESKLTAEGRGRAMRSSSAYDLHWQLWINIFHDMPGTPTGSSRARQSRHTDHWACIESLALSFYMWTRGRC